MRARPGDQKGERGRGVGQPTGRRPGGGGASERQRATSFPRLWSWAAAWGVVADRRAFPGRGFSEPTGAIRRGSFPDTPSAPCGGAGFSGRRAARDPRRHRRARVFLFPENEPGPGVFFSSAGFPGGMPWGFPRGTNPAASEQRRTQYYADEFTNGSRDEYSPGGRPGYKGHRLNERKQINGSGNTAAKVGRAPHPPRHIAASGEALQRLPLPFATGRFNDPLQGRPQVVVAR